MAQTRGDHAVKRHLSVEGNAKLQKGLDSSYLEVIDEKDTGVAGGSFPGQEDSPGAASWITRDLTRVIHNDFAIAVNLAPAPGLGADIELGAGSYYAEISAPALNVNEHVARLADVTDNPGQQGDTVILGTSEFAADTSIWETGTDGTQAAPLPIVNAATSQTRSIVTGRFTLSSQRTLEIQHRCTKTQTTDGLGSDGAFYETFNVFTVVKMWQVRDDTL
jgi:hypothetical protein